MAKKTLSQLEQEIARLQRQADALKAKEVVGVVARIKEAIAHFGLTANDLFDGGRTKASPTATAKKVTRKKGAKKKTAGVVRYRDDVGHTWTGHGTRPGWFKAALEAGKTLDDLKA